MDASESIQEKYRLVDPHRDQGSYAFWQWVTGIHVQLGINPHPRYMPWPELNHNLSVMGQHSNHWDTQNRAAQEIFMILKMIAYRGEICLFILHPLPLVLPHFSFPLLSLFWSTKLFSETVYSSTSLCVCVCVCVCVVGTDGQNIRYEGEWAYIYISFFSNRGSVRILALWTERVTL